MSLGKFEQLNQKGLHPIVSVLKYPKTRRSFNAVQLKGRVFRLTNLHAIPLGPKALDNNKRGFINSKMNTVAHAPSLYYWYSYRCGISFTEAKLLLEQRRLKANGVLIDKESDLEAQLEWEELRSMDIEIQNDRGEWVPALQRARHRWYSFHCLDHRQSQIADEAEPRSFVHKYQSFHTSATTPTEDENSSQPTSVLTTPTSSSLNVIRPSGMLSYKMAGLSIVTNDVSTLRHWNNESLGNNGLYDIRFPLGTPDEVYRGALRNIQEHLHVIQARADRSDDPSLAIVPQKYSVSLQELPDALRGKKDVASLLHELEVACQSTRSIAPKLDHSRRLLVATPLFPYRLAKRLTLNRAYVTNLKVGPFSLPPSLITKALAHHKTTIQQQQSSSTTHGYNQQANESTITSHSAAGSMIRPLTVEELVAFFAFERKMKTNRIIHSLQEFNADHHL